MGDSIDNVAGVPGIGEKGARDLIAPSARSTTCWRAPARCPQKKYREGLQTHADEARQSRELVRIRTDVEMPFDPEAVSLPGPVERTLLRAVLAARLPHARHRVCADRLVDRQGLRGGRQPRRARDGRRRRCAQPGGSRCASSPTDRRACARRSSASCFRPRRGMRATCRSGTRASPAARRSIARGRSTCCARCSRTRRSARSATT